jgi:inosine/xanthosine triphosphatase
MKIAICGSLTHMKEMLEAKEQLVKMGFEVELPHSVERFLEQGNFDETKSPEKKNWYMLKHFKKIEESNAILVVNADKNGIKNYIGGNTLMEMGIAMQYNVHIFLLNPSPDVTYLDEINGSLPILINGDIGKILEFKNKLEKVYVASESTLKLRSASLGFQKFLGSKNIIGKTVSSEVSPQPIGLVETIKGAENRLQNLKKLDLGEYEYLVSLESGLIFDEEQENYFDLGVCIVENSKGRREIGLSSGINIPNEIIKEVKENNLELGPLMQRKYNLKEKDPAIYYSQGKISRSEILREVVCNTLSMF